MDWNSPKTQLRRIIKAELPRFTGNLKNLEKSLDVSWLKFFPFGNILEKSRNFPPIPGKQTIFKKLSKLSEKFKNILREEYNFEKISLNFKDPSGNSFSPKNCRI